MPRINRTGICRSTAACSIFFGAQLRVVSGGLVIVTEARYKHIVSVAQEQILQSFGIAWFPAVRSVGGVCLVKEGKTVDVAGHEIPDVGSGIPRVTRHYFDQHQPVDHLYFRRPECW